MSALTGHNRNVFLNRTEYLLLGVLFLLGATVRVGVIAEQYQFPGLIIPDYDQTDLAIFYNHGQQLANEIRSRLCLPQPDPLPSSPVSMTQNKDECFLRLPAYPFFLALVFVLTGNALMAPIVLQSLMGLINAILAWRLTRRIGGPFPALLTAAFMLFYWVLIVYEGVYHAQTLMIFLALIFLNALEIWSEKPSLARAVLTGCFFALHLFASPSAILFMPVAMLWMAFWIHFSSQDWRSAARQAYRHIFSFALGTTVLVAPVTISNWMADGHFTLISTGGGYMLMFGNHEGADGYFKPFESKELGIQISANDYGDICEEFQRKTGIKLIPAVVNKLAKNAALGWIRAHPDVFLRLTLKRAVIFWQPKEISHNVQEYCAKQMSRILRWLPGGFPEILGGLGAAVVMGLFSWRGVSRPVRLRWLLPALYSLVWYLPFTVFYYAGHYRVPILPFLAMLAAGGVWSAVTSLRKRPMVAGIALCFACALWLGTRLIPVDYESDWERWFYYRPEAVRRFQGENDLAALESLVESANLSYSPSACLFMAQQANQRKDFSSAITWCRRGLRIKNLTVEYRQQFLEGLTSALLASGENSVEVEHLCRELLKYAPENFNARMYLADLALKDKNYHDALIHLVQAVETKPQDGLAWFLLGQCQMALGFPDLAEEAYRKGLDADLSNPWPAMGLAGILEQKGQITEARKAVEEALRRVPELQAAHEMLQRLNDLQ